MKGLYTKLILSAILSGWGAVLSAQLINSSFELNNNQAYTNRTYTARDRVSMKPGFVYQPAANNSFRANIDKSLLVPFTNSTYMTSGGVITTNPTLGGIVGTIPGQFAVGASGAANYSITIEGPSGINGVQPNLSLVYNSQGGDGAVGVGWNLSGLSSITRTTKNIIRDREIAGLSFTEKDLFAVDGNTLLQLNGIYGANNSTYKTELKTYSKIESFGNIAGKVCPQYFSVTSKDGQVIEYGATADSRITPVGATLPMAWLINKVTDANGNYMTFSYQSQNGNVVLSRVDYTGNGSSKAPFSSIKFNYSTKAKIKKSFVAGFSIEDRFILNNIEVKTGTTLLRQYSLTYNYEREHYFLKSVGLSGLNGERLNNTNFEWGSNSQVISTRKLNYPSFANPYGLKNHFMAVDLNGDGFTDMVNRFNNDKTNPNEFSSPESIEIKLNNKTTSDTIFGASNGVIYDLGESYTSDNYISTNGATMIGSFHGSSTRTLIVPSYNKNGSTYWVNFKELSSSPITKPDENNNAGMYIVSPRSSRIECLLLNRTQFTQRLSQPGMPAMTITDLNNDGIDEIISIEKQNRYTSHWETIPAHYETYTDENGGSWQGYVDAYDVEVVDSVYPRYGKIFYVKKSDYSRTGFSYALGDRVISQDFNIEARDIPSNIQMIMAADCNADGLKDLIMVSDNEATIFKNNGGAVGADGLIHPTFTKVPSNTAFNAGFSGIRAGDFNGDGLTDLILNGKNSPEWKVAINNGNFGFNYYNLPNFNSKEEDFTEYNNDKDDCIVTDFNNDGKSDIVMVDLDYDYNDDKVSYPWGTYNHTTITWYASNGTGFDIAKQFSFNQIEYFDGRRHGYTDGSTYTYNSNNMTGDFDGDGREDLLIAGNNLYDQSIKEPNLYLHSSPNVGYTANVITKITDGMGSATAINYQPLTVGKTQDGTPFYTKRNDAVYPVIDVVMPTYCVRSVSEPYSKNSWNGSANSVTSGWASRKYSYNGVKAHLLGKGMLGFMSQIVTDSLTDRKSESNTDMDYALLMANKQTTVNSTITGHLISRNETTLTNTLSDKVYESRPSHTVEFDAINNLTKTTDTQGYDAAGNPTQIVITEGNLVTTKDIVYGQFGNWAWCNNKPTKITTTKSQNGDTDVREIAYTYDSGNGRQLSETVDPTDENKVAVVYDEFDIFGRSTKVTTTANGKSRVNRVKYTDSGRFVEKKTNTFDQSTTYQWDETSGLMLSETDYRGRKTSYSYNGMAELQQTDYPDGRRAASCMQWATPGNSYKALYYSFAQASGSAPVYTYFNADGQEIVKETYGLRNSKILVYTEYLADGKKSKQSDPTFGNPDVWAAIYNYNDPYGRVTSVTTPFGVTSSNYNGRTTTITTPESVKTTVLNSAGQVETTTINGKSVAFAYYASGLTKSSTPQDGQPISMVYNKQGKRTKLTDPDAGVVESKYNGFGELLWERQKVHNATDWVTTTNNYDDNGLLQNINRNGGITTYTYDPVYKTRVKDIEIVGKNKQSFEYDSFDRVIHAVEIIRGRVFDRYTAYDQLGRVTSRTSPSGYTTYNHYDANSNLISVTDNDYREVWTAGDENAKGQVTRDKRGTYETTYGFDSRGLPTSIVTGGIMNAEYHFDQKGNLEFRTDYLSQQKEIFQYDTMNRLTSWDTYGDIDLNCVLTKHNSITWNATTGNIDAKSDLNNLKMNYGANGKPHALTSIDGKPDAIPTADLTVTYTDFKKIATLAEGSKYYILGYGVDDQRRVSEYRVNGVTKETRYYLGDYEEVIDSLGNTKKIDYISGGNGIAAIYVKDEANWNYDFRYAFTDFQGSLMAVIDEYGYSLERYAYDPWGARRDVDDWSKKDTRTSWFANRGYTGHEHLDAFGIINMNGRVYDPATAMFLSPDPYVQAPDNWINYNRYGYCYGNPFKYTDPSGEFFFTALLGVICPPLAIVGSLLDAACWGAAISGAGYAIGCVINGGGWNSGAFWNAVAWGGISGAVTFGVGQLFDTAKNIGTLSREIARGITHGITQGIISGASGGDFLQGFLSGSFGSLGGSAFVALGGKSVAGVVIASSLSGGISAELTGGDFFQGAAIAAIIGLLNHGENRNNPIGLKEVTVYGKMPAKFKAAPWMLVANSQLGVKEKTHNNDGVQVEKYLKTIGLGPGPKSYWCGAFVNWTFQQTGIPVNGINPGWALDWRQFGESLDGPAFGAVASKARKGGGHVGFVAGETPDGKIVILGGNQGDMVSYQSFSLSELKFNYPSGYNPNYDIPIMYNISINTKMR